MYSCDDVSCSIIGDAFVSEEEERFMEKKRYAKVRMYKTFLSEEEVVRSLIRGKCVVAVKKGKKIWIYSREPLNIGDYKVKTNLIGAIHVYGEENVLLIENK